MNLFTSFSNIINLYNTTMRIMHIRVLKNLNSFKKLNINFLIPPNVFFLILAFWINESQITDTILPQNFFGAPLGAPLYEIDTL